MPLKNQEGAVVQWFGTNTDVTDIVAARETLARSQVELERVVRQRTAQLMEANTNLQTFTYSAAHDLRAPLRSLRSFSRIVLEDYGPKLDEEGRGMLERIAASSAQMDRLLTDLLEYSRLSAAELTLEPVDLRKSVQDSLALLEGEVRNRNATVQVQEPLPRVIGHPSSVVLLLHNLISNALKFTAPGVPPQVCIGAVSLPHSVRMVVEDNGIGIDPRDQNKLFGLFERLHAREDYPGTGLGLAMVRKAAERMGGTAGVESEPGKGSRFWVELKAA